MSATSTMPSAAGTDVAVDPTVCIDGNEAAAKAAYAMSETVAIYPITPASPMGEHGPEHVSVLLDHLRAWLEVRGYASVRELIGAVSQSKVPDPAAFERANYLATLTRYASERKGW